MAEMDGRDKGVIGMVAFLGEAKEKAHLAEESSEQVEKRSGEYASSGEWGKMTDLERSNRIKAMNQMRSEVNAYAGYAGKGRLPLVAVAAFLAVLTRPNGNEYFTLIKERLLLQWRKIFGLGVAAILAFLYPKRARPLNNGYDPEAPYSFPFIGMTLQLLYGNYMEGNNNHIYRYIRQIGFRTIELNAMDRFHAIAVMDPVDRKHVLKDNWKNYLKNTDNEGSLKFREIFAELLGTGIFAVDKREWQDHRKVASSMFSVNGLRGQMEHVFLAHGNKLVQFMDKFADEERVVDMQAIFQSFTFDTICEIAFGIDTCALDSAIAGKKCQMLLSFDKVQVLCSNRVLKPSFLWRAQKYLCIGSEAELVGHAKFICDYVDKVIADRRKRADFADRKDLLSLYIKHARKTGQSYMEEDEYLRDVILNFMIAGRDTTSCTLTNWFKLIGTGERGKLATDSLVEEFHRVIPDNRNPSWEAVSELTYADAVFNEALRYVGTLQRCNELTYVMK